MFIIFFRSIIVDPHPHKLNSEKNFCDENCLQTLNQMLVSMSCYMTADTAPHVLGHLTRQHLYPCHKQAIDVNGTGILIFTC